MLSYYEGEMLEQLLPEVQDTIGNAISKEFCGDRTYEVVNNIQFLSVVDNNKLVFDTTLVELNKEYPVDVQVKLENYPAVTPVTTTVLVKVNTCRIDAIVPPSDFT